MEVILMSIFSAIIIFLTVYSITKALMISYKRSDITLRKFRVLLTTTIAIGLLVASALPFGYLKIVDTLLKPV